jgi:hypothetical protein
MPFNISFVADILVSNTIPFSRALTPGKRMAYAEWRHSCEDLTASLRDRLQVHELVGGNNTGHIPVPSVSWHAWFHLDTESDSRGRQCQQSLFALVRQDVPLGDGDEPDAQRGDSPAAVRGEQRKRRSLGGFQLPDPFVRALSLDGALNAARDDEAFTDRKLTARHFRGVTWPQLRTPCHIENMCAILGDRHLWITPPQVLRIL